MAFCPNCGTPNTEEAEKCAACGFELTVPKQKAKFKGTIMMSGIKAPTQSDAPAEPPEPASEPAAPSLPPPASAAKPGTESGRNPNYAKTMLGHAPVLAPLAKKPEPAAEPERPSVEVEWSSASATSDTSSLEKSSEPPRNEPARNVAASSAPAVIVSQEPRDTPDVSGSASWTGTGAPRGPSRTGVGGYDSTVPPSAPPSTPKPARVIAIGCAVALALFCVVGGILYYVVGAKIRSLMGEEDSGAEAAAWQASIVQSLAQVSELCKTDCTQAAVYFHPLKEASLLGEAKALTAERLQKLSDSAQTQASMLNGTEDEAVASKLGLDPQQCARVSTGAAKVISCSVPDPTGKPSVLRIVELAGISSL